MWWIYALLSAFFAALMAILAKKGLADINSDLAMAIRTVVVLVVAWGLAFARGNVSGIKDISSRTMMFLILSGVATGLSWIFYFKALQIGKVSQVAPVDKLSVALTIIFAVIFLGEELTLKAAAGAALIIVGTLVLIF